MAAGDITPDWQGVPVRWRGIYIDGSPARGKLVVRAAVTRMLDDGAAPLNIFGRDMSFPIESDGTVTMTLPATDDPDITPTDFTYTITEQVEGVANATYIIEVPLSEIAAGIELNRAVAVSPSPGTPVSLVTRAEFDALEALVGAGGGGPVDVADLPAGSTITVHKTGGAWPGGDADTGVRPTARTDITVMWKGPDPSPAIVASGTAGMLDDVDIRLITP